MFCNYGFNFYSQRTFIHILIRLSLGVWSELLGSTTRRTVVFAFLYLLLTCLYFILVHSHICLFLAQFVYFFLALSSFPFVHFILWLACLFLLSHALNSFISPFVCLSSFPSILLNLSSFSPFASISFFLYSFLLACPPCFLSSQSVYSLL